MSAAFDFGPAPTPQQRGYDRACREIVAWLRAQNNDDYPPPDDQSRGAWNAYSGAACCIERGDHKPRRVRQHLLEQEQACPTS